MSRSWTARRDVLHTVLVYELQYAANLGAPAVVRHRWPNRVLVSVRAIVWYALSEATDHVDNGMLRVRFRASTLELEVTDRTAWAPQSVTAKVKLRTETRAWVKKALAESSQI